jgi:hypothetical protein
VEDSDILRHLLKVEAEAASLAHDAAAEADRREAESEKQSRRRYDEAYTQEAAALEERYKADIAAVKIDYQRQIDEFSAGLDAMPIDAPAFSRLLDSLLFEKE